VLAEATADGEVAGVALTVEGASGVLAAEPSQVVHRSEKTGQCPEVGVQKEV
jgi:hypothetical protein